MDVGLREVARANTAVLLIVGDAAEDPLALARSDSLWRALAEVTETWRLDLVDPLGASCFVGHVDPRHSYRELVGQVREAIDTCVSADGTVLVVSKGDEDLLMLDSRRGWHFPQTGGGVYAGEYPLSAAVAIEHLEDLRLRGAEYLVFPKTAFWWLDHYEGFREHLESDYSTVLHDPTCLIFDLRSRRVEGRVGSGDPPTDTPPSRTTKPLARTGSSALVTTMSPRNSSTGLRRRQARRANFGVELAAVLAESGADCVILADADICTLVQENRLSGRRVIAAPPRVTDATAAALSQVAEKLLEIWVRSPAEESMLVRAGLTPKTVLIADYFQLTAVTDDPGVPDVIVTTPTEGTNTSDALAARLEENTATLADSEAFRALLTAALKGETVFRTTIAASRWFQTGLAKVLAASGLPSAGLQMHVAGAHSALVQAALAHWKSRDPFDTALVRSVLASPDLCDLIDQESQVRGALSGNARAIDRISGLPAIEKSVLSRNQPRRLAPVSLATTKPKARAKTQPKSVEPHFSVVLGVYNGAEFLAETLESVRSQSFQDYEFIIVDDTSTDGTLAIASEYAAADPRISIIGHEVNVGQAAALNTGVAAARGTYIAFIDADDIWLPEKLGACAKYLDIHEGIEFLQHNLKLLIDDLPSERLFRPVLASGDYIQQMLDAGSSLPGPFSPTAGLVFSRKLLERVMPIPVALRTCADGYLTRTAAALTNVASAPVALGYYRLHGANATVGNDNYDVSSYVERVVSPMIQAFYDNLDPPITLPRFKESRQRRIIHVPADLQMPEDIEFDTLLRDALRFLSLGTQPSRPFSQGLQSLLSECRDRIQRSDIKRLLMDVLDKRPVFDEDRRIVAALSAWNRIWLSDWNWIEANIDRLLAQTQPSVAVAQLAARLGAVRNLGLKAERWTDSHLQTDLIGFEHLTFFGGDYFPHAARDYLTVQRAVIKKLGYNDQYFDCKQWVVETVETVDGWSNLIRSDNTRAKLFAARRLAPPTEVVQFVAECQNAPALSDTDGDWSRAAALDLAGATVFSGEWYVRSAEGQAVVDAYSGTPHHAPSVYGRVSQVGARFDLVYSSAIKHHSAGVLLGGDDNYYHWIHDVLPRACWFAHDRSLDKFAGVVVRPQQRFQSQILAALDIHRDRLIELEYPELAEFDRLVIPLLSPQNRALRPMYGPVRRWAHDFFGRKVCRNYSTEAWNDVGGGRKIFALRGNARRRTVVDEAVLADKLAEIGFETIDAGKMTVAEQVATFNSASAIVGAHGAALVNIGFCRPGTRVTELAFPTWPSDYFRRISIDRGIVFQRHFMRTAIDPVLGQRFAGGYVPVTAIPRLLQVVI